MIEAGVEAEAAAAEIEASRRVVIRQGNGSRDGDSVQRQKTYFIFGYGFSDIQIFIKNKLISIITFKNIYFFI